MGHKPGRGRGWIIRCNRGTPLSSVDSVCFASLGIIDNIHVFAKCKFSETSLYGNCLVTGASLSWIVLQVQKVHSTVQNVFNPHVQDRDLNNADMHMALSTNLTQSSSVHVCLFHFWSKESHCHFAVWLCVFLIIYFKPVSGFERKDWTGSQWKTIIMIIIFSCKRSDVTKNDSYQPFVDAPSLLFFFLAGRVQLHVINVAYWQTKWSLNVKYHWL